MKKLSLFILVCSFITLTFSIQAQQNTFSKVFEPLTFYDLSVGAIVPAYDNTYLLAGIANNGGIIINVDTAGNMLWNRVYSNNNPTVNPDVVFNNIIRTNDSCFLVIGSVRNPLNLHVDALYLKINSSGDTIWSKSLNTTDYASNFLSVQQTYDSGYIITGFIRNNTPPYEKVLVVKTDFEGNIQWIRNFEAGNHSNKGYSVKQTLDSCFILTGFTESLNPFVANAFLLKLLPTGDISWSKEISFISPKGSLGKDLIITSNGFLLYLSSYYSGTIVKTDFSGNVLWSKTFDQSGGGNHSLQKIHSTSDNNYIFSFGNEFTGGLSKIDSSGNLIWSKSLQLAPVDFIESNNKEYFIIGNGPMFGPAFPKKNPKSDGQIGIIQTDSLGNSQDCVNPYTEELFNDSTISNPTIFISVSEGVENTIHPIIDSVALDYYIGCVTLIAGVEETGKANPLHVYPNPSTDVVNIKSENVIISISLYSTTGNCIYSELVNKTSCKITTSTIQPGIYFAEIKTSEGDVRKKIIIQ